MFLVILVSMDILVSVFLPWQSLSVLTFAIPDMSTKWHCMTAHRFETKRFEGVQEFKRHHHDGFQTSTLKRFFLNVFIFSSGHL